MRAARSRWSAIAVGLVAWVGVLSPVAVFAARPLPQAPSSFVLDEPHILKGETRRALQALLATQQRKTSEQVVIAIFNTLGDEDLVAWTNQIFQNWKIGQRGKDNGVLLALYWKEHKVRIEVGYGLEPLLTDAKSKRIIAEDLVPSLKEGKPDQALVLATLAIFKTIQSPLIQSGEAEKILKEGGFQYRGTAAGVHKPAWGVWIFLGLIIFMILYNMLRRDTYFNRSGWGTAGPILLPPLRRKRRDWDDWGDGGFGGGGNSGGWGGGGDGFSGGGGSSGGGGASGDW